MELNWNFLEGGGVQNKNLLWEGGGGGEFEYFLEHVNVHVLLLEH